MAAQIDLFGASLLPQSIEQPKPRQKPKLKSVTRDWRAEIPDMVQTHLGLQCEGFEDLFDWKGDGIERMRVGLLITSIRDVCDSRMSEVSRDEVWDWILSDEYHPFSFLNCLAEYDPRIEPDTMRNHIRWLSRKLLGEDVDDINFREMIE